MTTNHTSISQSILTGQGVPFIHQVGRDNVLMDMNKMLQSGDHHHGTAVGVCSTACSPALRKTWLPQSRQNNWLLYSSAAMTRFVNSMSRFFVHLDILYLNNVWSFWWRVSRSLQRFFYLPWRLPLLQSRVVEVAVLFAIFLSNGLLDPWSSGGVLYNLSSSTVAVIIPEGAHHLDLRASNPADPVSVRTARYVHRKFIRLWLRNHKLSEHVARGGM